MNAESKNNYSLHGVADFSLSGAGPLFSYLAYQYENFLISETNTLPGPSDFAVTITATASGDESDRILISGDEGYARSVDGEGFIWSVNNKAARLDGQQPLAKQTTLLFDPSFNKMKASVLCELFWRLSFVEKQVALVHAACVAKGSEAILLPAWKNAGKTATCLKLVAAGSDFLADDRLWLRSDGVALAFPRYVVLKDSNLEHFPEICSIMTKIKLLIFSSMSRLKWLRENALFKRVRRRFIRAQYFRINDLYPAANILSQSKVNKTVQLVKSRKSGKVEMRQADSTRTASTVSDIGDVEWNHSLQTLVSAHDILFPDGPCWSDELSALMHAERQVVREALSSTQCHQLSMPEENRRFDWRILTQKLLGP